MTDYTGRIGDFMQDALNEASTGIRAVKLAVFANTAANTRVRTGRLAGNWQYTEGAPSKMSLLRTDKSRSGMTVMADMAGADGLADSYLTNNLDYAKTWNDVDGYVDNAAAFFQQKIRMIQKK